MPWIDSDYLTEEVLKCPVCKMDDGSDGHVDLLVLWFKDGEVRLKFSCTCGWTVKYGVRDEDIDDE
jgi:hypothetical protein